ncbi:unnamed protein product [Rotaria socialis]|uniref:Alpha-MPP n=1 Tax=Rotaria socialis TaxID=392032 RepID=A0A818CSD8_9BILA|nr:unnamed protein product [Rotaria socialis]CAF3436264.1 unnamed protein product [Rotaria socialis]CAF3617877.1 unnamed protein product [Rotaria socialis]CAF4216294.1 unnamed protein product [Rotaria socialis]CAF4275557.1 unnamed protein product [Rotaria socialis]
MLKAVRIFSRQSPVNLLRRLSHTDNSSIDKPTRAASLGRDSTFPAAYNFPALSKSPLWLPEVKFAVPDSKRYKTNVTTLDNGLRVASEKLFGDFCTVGVIISAGPRFEGKYLSGVSHFLEKLAFMSTDKYQSRDQVIETLHDVNAICDCQTSRDITIYALSCRTTGVERVIELLSETIFRPKFLPEEIESAQAAVFNEIDDLKNRRYDPTPILTDMIHAAAYGNKTLGLPKYIPLDNISRIDTSMLKSFMKEFYRPERMVLAGVGIDHQQLVDLGNKYFSVPKSDAMNIDEKAAEQNKAVWTGGAIMEERDLSHLSFGADPLPENVHVALGFEAPCHKEEHDFVSTCVLSQMLGGGGSFSAGGPGKGLYSRFYLNVLNRNEQIKTAVSYNQAYSDSGCLYFHFGGDPSYLRNMIDVAIREIGFLVSERPGSVELERAKKQLQSMLFMNLEQRPVVFEDIARQVLSVGKRQQADYYYNRIERVQADDVYEIARRIFSKPLALAGLGKSLDAMRSYTQISDTIQRQLSAKTRWRIFG